MTSVLDGMTFDRSSLFEYWFPDPISRTDPISRIYPDNFPIDFILTLIEE